MDLKGKCNSNTDFLTLYAAQIWLYNLNKTNCSGDIFYILVCQIIINLFKFCVSNIIGILVYLIIWLSKFGTIYCHLFFLNLLNSFDASIFIIFKKCYIFYYLGGVTPTACIRSQGGDWTHSTAVTVPDAYPAVPPRNPLHCLVYQLHQILYYI